MPANRPVDVPKALNAFRLVLGMSWNMEVADQGMALDVQL